MLTEQGILKYLLPLAEYHCLSELVVDVGLASNLRVKHKLSASYCKLLWAYRNIQYIH